jgi:P27 family predicted phage terminase small subunit
MGKRGPAPTPSSILAARGSWRAKQNPDEPADDVVAPDPPKWLKGEGRTHWNYLVPILLTRRTISLADFGALVKLCQAWQDSLSARKAIEAMGDQPYQGHAIDHPRAVMAAADKAYRDLAIQFGLTPSAKSRVNAASQDKKPEKKGRFFGPRLATGS